MDSPGEILSYIVIGAFLLVLIIVLTVFMRKRKVLLYPLILIIVGTYVTYYFMYPTIITNKHEKAYADLQIFLKENYSEYSFKIESNFDISTKYAGTFTLTREDFPYYTVGVRATGKGRFKESLWTPQTVPENRADLWQALKGYELSLNLGTKLNTVEKLDNWSNSEFTAFAVMLNNKPAIAVYSNYPVYLYQLIPGEADGMLKVLHEDYTFIYIGEQHEDDILEITAANGSTHFYDTTVEKGKLIVIEP